MSKPRQPHLLTIDELTEFAADALVALYGPFNAAYVASCFEAGWLTDAERRSFAPLVRSLNARATANHSHHCEGDNKMQIRYELVVTVPDVIDDATQDDITETALEHQGTLEEMIARWLGGYVNEAEDNLKMALPEGWGAYIVETT